MTIAETGYYATKKAEENFALKFSQTIAAEVAASKKREQEQNSDAPFHKGVQAGLMNALIKFQNLQPI